MSSLHSQTYKNLRRELKARRKELEMNQEEVAKRLGVDQPAISKIENAERYVDLEEFIELARAYRMDPAELMRRICS